MAKLSTLVEAMAGCLGLPVTTVAAYAKVLRVERLLNTGGRGPGGAEMSAVDGANLLIAVLAGSVKDAVANVRQFRGLGFQPAEPRPELEDKLLVNLRLDPGHNFGHYLDSALKAGIASHRMRVAKGEAIADHNHIFTLTLTNDSLPHSSEYLLETQTLPYALIRIRGRSKGRPFLLAYFAPEAREAWDRRYDETMKCKPGIRELRAIALDQINYLSFVLAR